ncbi:HAMP domain-containing sensor histidine kinase [Nocardia sp. CNY236]|uniref:sensor histidine kinase n=1 Tax=Nocardia sp. CNY236 TaxID=1169152 RepID=UPI00041E9102|nr:HAMP domain-containing sensor histidine kinase [Nocardia sp. CNY236]
MSSAELSARAKRWHPHTWGLRGQVTAAFAALTALMSTTMATTAFIAAGNRVEIPYAGSEPAADSEVTAGVLGAVLIGCAVVTTLLGAALGWWASRRVLVPLHQLGRGAAEITSGDLDLRLTVGGDQDLAAALEAFNIMVDSLQRRIEREHRVFGDVSHELRTPLTTLMASVDVLNRHRTELPERSQRALGLVTDEVDHLRRLLDDLLALARVEAGRHNGDVEPLSVRDLLTHTLADRRYSADLLIVDQDVTVRGRKLELERAVANLLHNADRHGGGVVAVAVSRDSSDAVITVDDAGPGVPLADRTRIFERFATARSGRRSPTGTGIGLALVAETVATHRGRVECTERPGGGARFVMRLPRLGDIHL